ncbi:hypothetical protein Hanom_Chr05g00389491 [Helianthus anomalus]
MVKSEYSFSLVVNTFRKQFLTKKTIAFKRLFQTLRYLRIRICSEFPAKNNTELKHSCEWRMLHSK